MGHNQVLSRLFLIFSQTPSHPILTSRIPELVAFGYYSSLWVLHPKWLGYSRHFYKIMPLQSSKQNLDASNKGFSPTFSTPWYFIHFTLTPIHPTRVLQPGSKDIVHYPPPAPPSVLKWMTSRSTNTLEILNKMTGQLLFQNFRFPVIGENRLVITKWPDVISTSACVLSCRKCTLTLLPFLEKLNYL